MSSRVIIAPRYYAAIFLLLQACKVGTEPSPLPPEDRGTMLAAASPGTPGWSSAQLAWSLDGSEIFFLGVGTVQPPHSPTYPLLAANTFNSSVRVVDADLSSPQRLRLSADGKWVFYSADSPSSESAVPAIYRVATTARSHQMAVDSSGAEFAVSPDGGTVAYYPYGGDSLELFSLANGSRRALPPDLQPIMFSPDGTQIVTGNTVCGNAVHIMSLVDGSTQTVWGVGTSSECPIYKDAVGLRWDQGQLQVLYADDHLQDAPPTPPFYRDSLFVSDVATGGSRFLGQFDAGSPGAQIGWSQDGQRVVAWVDRKCVQFSTTSFGGCLLEQFILYQVDASSLSVTKLGQGNFATSYPPTNVVVSPDGRRVAYLADGALYTKPLQ